METHDVSFARTKGLSIPSWIGGVLPLLLVSAVVYLALFSTHPAIHDGLHKARHSLAIIPCH
jgi:cobalt transporter subunit CbtB